MKRFITHVMRLYRNSKLESPEGPKMHATMGKRDCLGVLWWLSGRAEVKFPTHKLIDAPVGLNFPFLLKRSIGNFLSMYTDLGREDGKVVKFESCQLMNIKDGVSLLQIAETKALRPVRTDHFEETEVMTE